MVTSKSTLQPADPKHSRCVIFAVRLMSPGLGAATAAGVMGDVGVAVESTRPCSAPRPGLLGSPLSP